MNNKKRRFTGVSRAADWRRKNPQKVEAWYGLLKARRKSNPQEFKELDRKYNLKKFYRLTVEEYEALLFKQGGVCAICGHDNGFHKNGKSRRLAVDHDHVTKRIRGLLCNSCNAALSRFEFVPDWAVKASIYLNERNNTLSSHNGLY